MCFFSSGSRTFFVNDVGGGAPIVLLHKFESDLISKITRSSLLVALSQVHSYEVRLGTQSYNDITMNMMNIVDFWFKNPSLT